MNLIFSGKNDLSEGDLENFMTGIDKSEDIKKNAILVGFDKLLIKSKPNIWG